MLAPQTHLSAVAATPATPSNHAPAAAKPAWLAEASVSFRETYDTNVFLSGVPDALLVAATPPPGGTLARPERDSFVTTASARVGFDLRPLLGSPATLQTGSLTYSTDLSRFHSASSEDHSIHRLGLTLKGKLDSLSWTFDQTLTRVFGDDVAPLYPGACVSAYGTAVLRERRDQWQERAKLSAQYDSAAWFARPLASLLAYDLRTGFHNIAGYQNYVDRHDLAGGADLGVKNIVPASALVLGLRAGRQEQSRAPFVLQDSSNTYQRVLVGLEGKPLPWLNASFLLGPDFRSYSDRAPLANRRNIEFYGESAFTATLGGGHVLSLKSKHFQWVSSTGRVPYFESCFDLTDRFPLTKRLSVEAGLRFIRSDYRPAANRVDDLYTLTLSATQTLTPRLSLAAGYTLDLARNQAEGVTNAVVREYDRHLISLGLTAKF